MDFSGDMLVPRRVYLNNFRIWLKKRMQPSGQFPRDSAIELGSTSTPCPQEIPTFAGKWGETQFSNSSENFRVKLSIFWVTLKKNTEKQPTQSSQFVLNCFPLQVDTCWFVQQDVGSYHTSHLAGRPGRKRTTADCRLWHLRIYSTIRWRSGLLTVPTLKGFTQKTTQKPVIFGQGFKRYKSGSWDNRCFNSSHV